MDALLKFLSEHKELLNAIPGFAEELYLTIERLIAGHSGTDAEKRAKIEALALEIRALAQSYRDNPPELPE